MSNIKKVTQESKRMLPKGIKAILVLIIYLIFILTIGYINSDSQVFTINLFGKILEISVYIKYFVIYLIFLIVMILIFKKDLKENWQELRSSKKNIWKILLYFIIFCVISFILTNIIINKLLELGILKNIFSLETAENALDTTNSKLFKWFNSGTLGMIFGCFFTVIFTPIVDELIFRKALGDGIKSKALFIIFSALLSLYFQVAVSISFTETPKSLIILTFILAIGSLFNAIFASIIYCKKKNIFYTIIPRMLFNIISATMTIFSVLGIIAMGV